MKEISVLTIVHNREKALLGLINGLLRNHISPAELVIVYMNEASYKLPPTPFPLLKRHINQPHHLPLAEARNQAVEAASCQDLVFLDADCIPHADLLLHYANAFEQVDTLWSGHVRYLRQGADNEVRWAQRLDELSRPDLIRTGLETLPYHLFWSLNFGCSKQTFNQIGGFDRSYTGYGAEDTDFAFKARQAGVPIGLLPAMAYHQYHPSYDPPLNHIQDIVANAAHFKQKWHVWPMEGWLRKFQQLGFIEWTPDKIELIRSPSPVELASALKP